MITIIDYGLGNIRAFKNVYERLNISVKIARHPADFLGATKIILPGVGAFDYAISQFNKSGMKEKVEDLVFKHQTPILGICLGMQMMAKNSEEGSLPGLGWIDGNVKKFNADSTRFKTRLPHMGWNSIKKRKENTLLNQLNYDSKFYFLHSYYFECEDEDDILCETDYGIRFSSAVNKENIYGVQFHPEKSHSNGIQLLLNFSRI